MRRRKLYWVVDELAAMATDARAQGQRERMRALQSAVAVIVCELGIANFIWDKPKAGA